MPTSSLRVCVPAALLCVTTACGSDPSTVDAGYIDDLIVGTTCAAPPTYTEDLAGCTPATSDYRPRDNGSADDDWAACISDDNTYHRIEESISSIARVEAYTSIGALLWPGDAVPTWEDFVLARVRFEEEQGLGSRVARRYDVHYPPPDQDACEDQGVADANPDYCVGPALLQPIIVAAFANGSQGHDRVVNAAKIEAALQWFFYVSAIKEATTCNTAPKDCDSSWAYYSGGTPRDTPIGLAADIDRYAAATYDRGYDGSLAVRCWRDLDQAVPAADLALRDLAIGQLDHALVRGMAILVRQRFLLLDCATGDYQRAALEALRILVPLLDRETRSRDPDAADLLVAEIAKQPDAIDVAAAVAAIDDTYPCP